MLTLKSLFLSNDSSKDASHQTTGLNDQSVKDWLALRLHDKRLRHSQGVSACALELAQYFGFDEETCEKAKWAGLLHDCAKLMNKQELQEAAEQFQLEFTTEDKLCPQTWHASVGAEIIRTELNVQDEDVLNAIRFHTTARAGMSWLELLVYVADKIEPYTRDPDFIAEVKMQIKDASRLSLLNAALYILNDTLSYLAEENQRIHPRTLAARNDLLERTQLAKNHSTFINSGFLYNTDTVSNHGGQTI